MNQITVSKSRWLHPHVLKTFADEISKLIFSNHEEWKSSQNTRNRKNILLIFRKREKVVLEANSKGT